MGLLFNPKSASVSAPLVVTGSGTLGSNLTASFTKGSGTVQFTRRPLAGGAAVDINGATGPGGTTYQIKSSDRSYRISARALTYLPEADGIDVPVVVPDAPTIGVATAGDGTVSLLATPAANDGGSAVIGYRGTLDNGLTQDSVTLPVIFSGLPNGFSRKGIVQALNSIGYSAPSDWSNSVRPQVVGTNIAARVWQTNMSGTTAISCYSGSGLNPFPTDTGVGTCMIITDFAADCTGIQLIMANYSSTQARRVIGFTAVCPEATGDNIYDSLFATAPLGTFNGGESFIDVPPRDPAATSVGMAVSDFYPLTPKLRTDAPSKRRLLAIREAANYPNSNDAVNCPAPYMKRQGGGWRDDPAGILMATGLPGNRLNSAWVSTAAPWANGNSTIAGVIFHYKNRAATIFYPGSSLVKNDLNTPSTKMCSGWPMQSAIAVSTEERPVEFINGGQAGQQLDKGVLAAQEVFRVLKPTHTCIEFANPNNLSAINASVINTIRAQTEQIIALAQANGSRPMLWNGWSRNVAASPYLASYYNLTQDNLRKAYLEEMRARGLPYMDTNALMNRGTSPDQIKMIGSGDPFDFSSDGLHETNDATNQVLTPGFATFLTNEVVNKYF